MSKKYLNIKYLITIITMNPTDPKLKINRKTQMKLFRMN